MAKSIILKQIFIINFIRGWIALLAFDYLLAFFNFDKLVLVILDLYKFSWTCLLHLFGQGYFAQATVDRGKLLQLLPPLFSSGTFQKFAVGFVIRLQVRNML